MFIMNKTKILEILNQGESQIIEFKSSFQKELIESIVAFSNVQGGTILIGVDNDGNVRGVTISDESVQNYTNQIKNSTEPSLIVDIQKITIDNKVILMLNVDEFPVKPVAFKGKYFKRVENSNHLMNLTEISNMHLQTINSSWDYYPDALHDFNDIDIEKVNLFIKKYEEKHTTKVTLYTASSSSTTL